MKTIQLTIDPRGKIEIDAVGFQGTDCEKATAFLERVLGPTRNKRRKPEYWLRNTTRPTQHLGL